MPSRQSLSVQDLYFKSLLELDAYENKSRSERLTTTSTTEYIPRRPSSSHGSRGRLLVCHDYKGGYTEKPLSLSYTFNYWSICDTFIYFSHHRVTIPPPGWVNAAHRQGVKMLGTLIFEGGAEPDCLRLVVGKLPSSPTGPAVRPHRSGTLPISPHYAISLAKLAQERGFDGYLLNFECALQGGVEQTRSLAAWISLLNTELVKRVGPHAETVWYDSVVFNGELRWQDRLNSYNLPFFIPSTSFFTNYTWRHNYPSITAQYFLSLDSDLLGSSTNSKPKNLQDIYVGIDVWGRGSHGGGGFGCFKALEHISPDSLGLSVALFGQAWTWESEQDKPDWTWDKWWQYERDLWVGSPNHDIEMPIPQNPKNSHCSHPHEKYKSLIEFFGKVLPPDPIDLAFHTSFCPGVGFKWFITGVEVFNHLSGGWTDVDKQTSMGDLLWPYPKIEWEVEVPIEVPNVVVSVHMEDAWNGGNSIKLDFTEKTLKKEKEEKEGEDGEEEVAFRSFWVPIQSLSLTTQQRYNTSIIYKVLGNGGEELALDFALSIRLVAGTRAEVEIIPESSTTTDLHKGWTKNTSQIVLKESFATNTNVECSIGLVITTVSEDPSLPFKLSLLLGQLNVFPSQSVNVDPDVPHILWVDYTTSTSPSPSSSTSSSADQSTNNTTTSDNLKSQVKLTTITWQPATSLQAITNITITSPEDPICVWKPQPSSILTTISKARSPWFPSFIYFNIYVCEPTVNVQTQSEADEALIWIGTSGMDVVGGSNFHFTFDKEQLGSISDKLQVIITKKFRVLVQGVLDTGETLPWEQCAYVDVTV